MFDNIRIVNLLRNSCFLVIDNDEFESYLFIYWSIVKMFEFCDIQNDHVLHVSFVGENIFRI